MTCNIYQTPYVEPLPLYSQHDPDAASIHSGPAPSYVSDVPTYTSRRMSQAACSRPPLLPPLSPSQRGPGLPPANYAPGFESRARGAEPDLNTFAIPSWSSTGTGLNSRQYEAVARRRANSQKVYNSAASSSMAAGPSASSSRLASTSPRNGSPNHSSTALDAYPVTPGSSSAPVNPLEDPYLVGEEAARRAQQARVYREMCRREEEAARHDNNSWDFMIVQMATWEERVPSRRANKSSTKSKLLGRLGLK
ncbi:hypothetical protein M011DRAFT_476052 [Sporormia fimetaria CBS 119925]|uniref:Uncharacterized protein n=1 Tax=Sporormia fimetaria CBS 119925 TaxID=1340428 RepID=A0A6A6VFS3_9PLEO|nr:hypothetical protein M011DRAFT_476052 [Sporormia fimetaria CBS 119925]